MSFFSYSVCGEDRTYLRSEQNRDPLPLAPMGGEAEFSLLPQIPERMVSKPLPPGIVTYHVLEQVYSVMFSCLLGP